MIIKKLEIISFGMLKDAVIELSDGLNVIAGDNETGKSTISAFIKFIFYGLSKQEQELYVPWGSSGCRGAMTLVSDGVTYRIERELITGRSKDRVLIISDSGEPVSSGKAPWELFLGVPENVFKNTLFTADSGSTVGGVGLPEAIENIIFSADEAVSTKKALKRLDEGRISLLYKNRKGGKIYELENRTSELECKLAAAKSASEKIFSLDDSIRKRRQRLSDNKKRIDLISKQTEDYEIYKRLNDIKRHKANLKTLEECQTKLDELKEKYTVNGYLPDRTFLEELKALASGAAQARDEENRCGLRSAEAGNEYRYSSDNTILRIASGIGGVDALRGMYDGLDNKIFALKKRAAVFMLLSLPFAIGAAALVYLKYIIPYAIICGALFLVMLIIGLILLGKAGSLQGGLKKLALKLGAEHASLIPELLDKVTDAAAVSEKASEAYNSALVDEQRAKQKTAAINEKIKDVTGKYIQTDIDGISDLILKVESIINDVYEASSRLEMAQYKVRSSQSDLGGEDEEELRSRLNGSLTAADMAEFDQTAHRTELNLLMRQNESIAEKISSEEQSLAAANATFTLPSAIYAKLLASRAELQEASKQYEAYILAYEKLSEASNELRNSISPTLASDASRFMTLFSNGKYNFLGISNKLDITYTADMTTHDVVSMSSGTQELAYVSLRLALIKLLFPKKAPAFFDDTFAKVDDTRAEMIIRSLASLGMQSVIFTCRGRDGELAAKYGGSVIEL